MIAKFQILILALTLIASSCANSQNNQAVNDKTHPYTNELIHESSPYLLQHAHNPVDWMPWGEAAFEKAKKENKLVLVSIGYSSCHWCHVMEHESFEDTAVANIMNDHFVCIKVDREERPDVDQVYMNAVQLMTGQGGWPLNCFTLADGRPIFGGTYFPKNKWVDILKKLHDSYTNNKEEVLTYAENLTNGIQQYELITVKEENKAFTKDKLVETVTQWSQRFDHLKGGPNKAPKFPLPNNYEFLMQYAYEYEDSAVMSHVDLTLKQMAFGGIYDQVGGGFARYSTDNMWKVPHFEKMLYDNAQLVSLYCHAFQRTKDPLYEHVVRQTLDWVEREMTTEVGSFYSALDADSEGEEGKYYVWSKEELKSIAGDDYKLLSDYYNIAISNQWEGSYILYRSMSNTEIAEKYKLSESDLADKIRRLNHQLLVKRAERERPGLDDKSLTSWNCMMGTAYLDAHQTFGDEAYLAAALNTEKWLDRDQIQKDGNIFHSYKAGESKINGFLEDYAFVIQFYVKLYEVTFEEKYLTKAKELTAYSVKHFQDEKSGMFYYTSDQSDELIARKMELSDNVIPASNSVMARNLWQIGTYYDDQSYLDQSKQMLANVYGDIQSYGSAYSNWSILIMNMVEPYYEVAITGPDWKSLCLELHQHYIPNKLMMGGEQGELPLLEGKFTDETTIFVCVNKACQMPVEEVSAAVEQMR